MANAMESNAQSEFGKIRSLIWPIFSYELKKVIPIACIFFFIFVIYNLLKALKISLILSAPNSGAEILPFVNMFVVLPGAFLFIGLITKLYNYFSIERVFVYVIFTFVLYFVLFLGLIYPNLEALHWQSITKILEWEYFPEGFTGFILALEHWPLSIFYAAAEIWGAAVGCMLFWGFANEVTKIREAKRFYATFVLSCNFSSIFAGKFGQTLKFNEMQSWLPYGDSPWGQTLFVQLSMVIMMALVITQLFKYLTTHVVANRLHPDPAEPHAKTIGEFKRQQKTSKPKMSLWECFRYMIQSKYMTYIVIIMVAYNIVYGMSDILFLAQAKAHAPDVQTLNDYINQINIYVGFASIFFALVICGNVVRKFGWTVSAIITPIIWLVTSSAFFCCLLYPQSSLSMILIGIVGNPANAILLFGAMQMSLGRASKYTVFDETKEMAFIPLSPEEQRKGKAVVDGIAARLGKTGGSVIYFALLGVFGNLAATTPYVAGFILALVIVWMVAVVNLGRMTKESIDKEQTIVDEPVNATEGTDTMVNDDKTTPVIASE